LEFELPVLEAGLLQVVVWLLAGYWPFLEACVLLIVGWLYLEACVLLIAGGGWAIGAAEPGDAGGPLPRGVVAGG
jgi:hypothetical protein